MTRRSNIICPDCGQELTQREAEANNGCPRCGLTLAAIASRPRVRRGSKSRIVTLWLWARDGHLTSAQFKENPKTYRILEAEIKRDYHLRRFARENINKKLVQSNGYRGLYLSREAALLSKHDYYERRIDEGFNILNVSMQQYETLFREYPDLLQLLSDRAQRQKEQEGSK